MVASDPISTLIGHVRTTLRTRGVTSPRAHLLVACSGGPDSAALLAALAHLAPELGLRLHAASVDHGLRADSARDVETARAQAEAAGVPFRRLEVHVERAGSRQAAARNARYAGLQREAARVGAAAIAVGHTADDQAETVLARLLKGAGLRGLGAMAARRPGLTGEAAIVRPLIDCARAEVLAFVEARGLVTARDPSNLDSSFQRSRIRAVVLPALREEDPRVVQHLCALADEAREIEAWIDERLAHPERERLDTRELQAVPRSIAARLLRRWLSAHTGRSPRRAHLEATYALGDRSGEVLLGEGWLVSSDGRELCVRHDPASGGRSERAARASDPGPE